MHALSLGTWWIHLTSVIEWILAILLVLRWGERRQEPEWRWLSLAMTPALVSALCACTWHIYDNAEQLDWLVQLQAAMTLIGNGTLALAAWWIWRSGERRRRGC
ncbi:MAG: DUF2499 domain-containing protein [Aphanocapsa feldmannii 277cV]|uniref:DUF2499 domain-containing protein n=2 Tax=Aphanocapsa feldmannii TaxID=192050 RepID=A0A524RR47_9CHRO|nr:MAG: DUF2499 domain-containing protein [Aphanocapsa feldmannii 288cV]TGG96804.1 MAG: DUF2499 domain-containing protein [Aphanocapsa feldmannii 277cV]TGH19608.1 MAG: DUF2499 domain-containing protein [Aphanocapsa feldmannii 277cI]